MISSLVLVLVLHLQATVSNAQIFLDHVYKNENDFNNVELRCFNDEIFPDDSLIAGARFFVTPSGGPRRRIGESSNGVLDYTLTPETEGELSCRHSGQGSMPPLELAGESGEREELRECELQVYSVF